MLLLKLMVAVLTPIQWHGVPPIDERDLIELRTQNMCFEFVDEAMNAGWASHELPRLMRIMHRESRCIPTACSIPDKPQHRKCRDWGLMQINDYSWKRRVRELGFDMKDLHDPQINLLVARWLYELAEETGGCGWSPWNGKC